MLTNEIFFNQTLSWNFKMELCLNRELVWKFLDWNLIIPTAFFVKLQFVEWCYNSERRQDSSWISRSQTYFLISKRRAFALFNLMETLLTLYCQLKFVSIFRPRCITLSVGWCTHTFGPPPTISVLYPPLGLTHSPTVAQSIIPPGDAGRPWPMKWSELLGCWQMHRYCTYKKYFVNKLTTLSLYKKSFINNTTFLAK